MKRRRETMSRQPEMHDDDRISALPDEIIHQIMEQLKSPKQAAEAALLSKRWIQLWGSYPILEFSCYNYRSNYDEGSTLDRFLTAASKRVDLNSIKVVRVHVRKSVSSGRIFDKIANRHLQEIVLSCDDIYGSLPTQLFDCGLPRILKLTGFQLRLPPAYCLDTSTNLRVLHLERCACAPLNNLIACAPLLENLTLEYIHITYDYSVIRLQNHPNLKCLKIDECYGLQSVEVVGANSLEIFSLRSSSCVHLKISPSSNLKWLVLAMCPNLEADAVSELISNSSSLLSLYVGDFTKMDQLKIRSRTLEYLEIRWGFNEGRPVPRIVPHVDAPELNDFRLDASMDLLPAITNILQDAKLCRIELTFHLDSVTTGMFSPLLNFLAKLNRQSHCVHLNFHPVPIYEYISVAAGCRAEGKSFVRKGKKVEDESSAPAVVEHVKFHYYLWENHRITFLYNLFRSFHPKYLSVDFEYATSKDRHSDLESISQVFMEAISCNGPGTGCRSWRRQLKDVKLVNTRNIRSEELMDISTGAFSCLKKKDKIMFRLIWH